MATQYSKWSNAWLPSGANEKRHYRAYLSVTKSAETDTYVQYKAYVKINIDYTVSSNYSGTLAVSGDEVGASTPNGTVKGSCSTTYGDDKTVTAVSTRTYTFYKTTEPYIKTFKGGAYCTKSIWTNRNWVYATIDVEVPALAQYSVTYSANGGEGEIEPQIKFNSIDLTLSDNKDIDLEDIITRAGHSVKEWNTMPDGSGTVYNLGGEYAENSAMTLYAIWQAENPPKVDVTGFVPVDENRQIKYFGQYKASFIVRNIYEGRTATAKLKIGEAETEPISILEGGVYDITSDIIEQSGTLNAYLVLEDFIDDEPATVTQVSVGKATLSEPIWERTFHIDDAKKPDLKSNGKADIKVYLGVDGGTSEYEEQVGNFVFKGNDYDWDITIQFGERYVDNPKSMIPNVSVKFEYTHTDTDEKESRLAFYNTTRNQNFSNGIYSVMFVGGVEPEKSPSYASRVWWCYINNPLYFPDTNYAEVGSNDTRVMGLCKVGDYLGVVKQSKTTDTAVYLLYPTSFDEDTTFAQKQGIQGVGAIAKYSFNVLGDETLFLSPEGVMAIRPDGDESHKVVNRSFFIDGKLLSETSIEEAYSFVFDGKYWLSIGDHCYVLDGNQQSSWGNDRTNLVLEAYYLENIPASCFMKVGNELWFSNETEVCRFKGSENAFPYTDAYLNGEGIENVPVKAEWSTVLDDDGTLSYYKTMQKKGAVVSILPEVFPEDEERYIGTKVFVRKDTDEPVEIERDFSTHDETPNEVYINKKFKKYKRLQFIVRNEEAEPFGVNSIVKQYIIGNFAKK